MLHRDLFRGWGAQGFPTPEVDFPSLEFLKYIYIGNSTQVLKYVQFSPPEEPTIDNPVLIHVCIIHNIVCGCLCTCEGAARMNATSVCLAYAHGLVSMCTCMCGARVCNVSLKPAY